MQVNIRLLSVLTLATFTFFTACKKENTPKVKTSQEVKDQTEEQNRISSDMDAMADDINIAVESTVSFSGRNTNVNQICGANISLDTVSNPRTITVSYDGLNCGGTHYRTGVIVLSMASGMKWKDAGAVLNVTFTNLKIKRISDNKSITINGTQTFTNVNGGLFYQLSTMDIVHTIVSNNMSVKFDDNSVINWQVAKKREFTYDNGAVCTVSGIHTEGTNTQIAEWGTTRSGENFVTTITEPVIFRQDCNFRITAGQIRHEGFATATVTFGLDAAGSATTCPGAGIYYYKIIWTGPAGNSITLIAPY